MTDYIAVAPDGNTMDWTRARSAEAAMRKVTEDWEFAVQQGYRIVPVAESDPDPTPDPTYLWRGARYGLLVVAAGWLAIVAVWFLW